MKSKCEDAIKKLAEKVGSASKADDAMKYAQAALNLAHILATLSGIENSSKKDN